MNLNKLLFSSFLLVLFAGCNASTNDSSNGTTPSIPTGQLNGTVSGLVNGYTLNTLTGVNVVALTVNGTTCAANTYTNKPCVSVTVCTHGLTGASNCDTVNDILVDTGSYGLRIFGSSKGVLNHAVPASITSGGGTLAECAQFGDGSKLWGPVQTADVVLGGEAAVQIPIQVIDSTYSSGMSANCSGASTDPQYAQDTPPTHIYAGFNGILGVGLAMRDCGSNCVSGTTPPAMYYSCNGSSCSASFTPLTNQVENPVAAQSTDNNGVIIELPQIGTATTPEAVSVNGYLVLGIGTRANNVPAGVTTFPSNAYAEFSSTLEGHTISSFIDSGSNAFYFPVTGTGLTDCGTQTVFGKSTDFSGWYCPNGNYTYNAINIGGSGSPSGTFQFQVDNYVSFYASANYVDAAAGGNSGGGIGGTFDLGLPFFFGRNVYVGIDTKTSSLGTGPYWAY